MTQRSTSKKIKPSSSMDFESWMGVLNQEALSSQDQDLLLKDLQEHPEWVNQSGDGTVLGCEKSALMSASKCGHIKVVKALIEMGAPLNAQDQYGWNALMHASHQGHTRVVEILTQSGVRLDDKNDWCDTALMLASSRGYNEVVKALVDAGAHLNIKDTEKRTALIRASLGKYTEVVKVLAQAGTCCLNDQDEYGYTALMYASEQGIVDIVKTLVCHGVDINNKNPEGETALTIASNCGHAGVVKRLIQAGADINFQNKKGWTALMFASFRGHYTIVQDLIDHDADPSVKNDNQQDALGLARILNWSNVVNFLELYHVKQTMKQTLQTVNTYAIASESVDQRASPKVPRL